MKSWRLLLILLITISASVSAMQQGKCIQPKLIKPIEDWDIVAYNKVFIKTASYFSGSDLTYSLSFKKINDKNKASINKDSGEIKIDAETKDNFNLKVNAQNSCGAASSTFNVQIDEEDDD